MKQLTSYNRVAGYLNKVFDILNAEFFECELSRPTITIQSTPKAYGHFSLREDTWVSKIGGTHEINIGAGTLSRPIEEVAATLLHEMVHYYNYVKRCKKGVRFLFESDSFFVYFLMVCRLLLVSCARGERCSWFSMMSSLKMLQ